MGADEKIVGTLPSLEQAPASFEAVVELGPYIFRGLTAEERKAGTVRSSQLLHIPGELCLRAQVCSYESFDAVLMLS